MSDARQAVKPSGRGRPRGFDRTAALERALQVFWEHGYEGTRVHDLTQAMGINPPSLYAAFGSKEDLFREAVDHYNAPERSITAQVLRGDAPIRDRVEALLRDNARAYVDVGTPNGCMIVLSAISYAPGNEELRDLLSSLRKADSRLLEEQLRRAVDTGALPAGSDVAGLASFIVTVLHGLSIQARDGVPLEMLDNVIDITLLAWDQQVAAGS
jgi:AcrR family transcriptional regulator